MSVHEEPEFVLPAWQEVEYEFVPASAGEMGAHGCAAQASAWDDHVSAVHVRVTDPAYPAAVHVSSHVPPCGVVPPLQEVEKVFVPVPPLAIDAQGFGRHSSSVVLQLVAVQSCVTEPE